MDGDLPDQMGNCCILDSICLELQVKVIFFFFSPVEQTGGIDSIHISTSGCEKEGNRTSNGVGSPEGGALVHLPFLAICITNRKKQDKISFEEGGHFSHRNFISCFEEKEVPSLPSTNALTTACSQRETTTTSNSCSPPINFCSKHPSLISS